MTEVPTVTIPCPCVCHTGDWDSGPRTCVHCEEENR